VKHVADGSASPRFGDRSRHDLIGARAGVDRLDPGKAFFEHRQNFHCSIRRQSAIDVQRAAFLQGLLVSVVDALGMTGEREGKKPPRTELRDNKYFAPRLRRLTALDLRILKGVPS